jgi:hypothetical protein
MRDVLEISSKAALQVTSTFVVSELPYKQQNKKY